MRDVGGLTVLGFKRVGDIAQVAGIAFCLHPLVWTYAYRSELVRK